MKKANFIFYFTYALYIGYHVILSSYYSEKISCFLDDLIKLVVILLTLFQISLINKWKNRQLFWIVFFLFISVSIYYKTAMAEPIILLLLIISSCHSNITKIFKNTGYLLFIITLFVIFSSTIEILPNDIYVRGTNNNKTVMALGFHGYATIPYIILMLNIIYIYVKKKVTVLDYIILLIYDGIIYLLFTNKLTLILNILLLILVFLFEHKATIYGKLYQIIAISLPWYFAFLCIGITYFFDISNPIMYRLNNILSWRLYYGHIGMDRYPIRLFGEYIAMRGNLALGKTSETPYFYIDCGYVHTLLNYGLVFEIFLLILYSIIGHYAIKTNDKKLFSIYIVILTGNCINNIWINLSINPILLISFIAISYSNDKNHTKSLHLSKRTYKTQKKELIK